MTVTITVQTVITASAFIAACIAIVLYFTKAVRWFDGRKKLVKDVSELKQQHSDDISAIQKELSIITRAQLAALKGLQEKGCNGPVTKAINELEDYLNIAAHE